MLPSSRVQDGGLAPGAAEAPPQSVVPGSGEVKLPPPLKEDLSSPGPWSTCACLAGADGGTAVVQSGAQDGMAPESSGDVSLAGTEGPPTAPRRPSHAIKLLYAAPGLATTPFTFMFGMHGNQSYQAFGASISIMALSVALARSFDVLSDPLMSYWTDTAKFRWVPKWLQGRRRPFMFFGAFLYSGALLLLMNPPYASKMVLSVYFGVSYTLFFLASTFVCIPYDALAAELSDDANHRVGVFFVTSAFDSLGIMGAMALPSLMTRFATSLHLNGDICRPAREQADLCLQGHSCGGVETGGMDEAFSRNATLAALLSPLQGMSLLPQDAVRACLVWQNGNAGAASVLGSAATVEQTAGFCSCVMSCTDACEVADRRTGFAFVGCIFAAWFMGAMLLAVCWLRERPASERAQAGVPAQLVPRMRGLLHNRPFRFLLPAWIIEAFGNALNGSLFVYFLECIVAPAQQTMELNGHDCAPSSPDFDGGRWVGAAGRGGDWMCSQTDVTAAMGWCQNIGLLCFMPLWPLLATKLGKVETWLLVSFLCMATEVMKLFIQDGQVFFALVVFGLATLPHGGKFLGDVIMTDIIDYDEFLTGTRNEATYFMFKSFIPKIILIPAAAIPLALLRSFGYLEPQGGRLMSQPASVRWYIRSVCLFNIGCQFVALFLKWSYPLRRKQVEVLAESVREIRAGRAAPDPITGRMHKPLNPSSQEQRRLMGLLGHFPLRRLRTAFHWHKLPSEVRVEDGSEQDDIPIAHDNPTPAANAFEQSEPELQSNPEEADRVANAATRAGLCESTQELVRNQRLRLLCHLTFLVGSVAGVLTTVRLIAIGKLAWVPTLFVVCVGAACASVLLSWKTLGAATALHGLASSCSLSTPAVEALLEHRLLVRQLGRRGAKA